MFTVKRRCVMSENVRLALQAAVLIGVFVSVSVIALGLPAAVVYLILY
jgi:hypothetical protein